MRELIKATALAANIDPDVFLAVCMVESSLDPLAIRFEKHYKWLWFPREHAQLARISYDTEVMLQSCSYGLGQVMGAVVREQGYKGPLQKLLLEPDFATAAAAKHLRKFYERHNSETDAISAYNQGSPRKTPGGLYVNQGYVDKVCRELREIRKSSSGV